MKGITTGNITLNDYMNMSIPGSFPRISLHKMLDVFIDIFSLSSSNEENKRKEIMKKFFRYKLRQSINEMPKEKGYIKSNISSVKNAEDTDEYIHYNCRYIDIAADFLGFLSHLEELKKTNPEIFKNIDYVIYYLLGREKQTKKKSSRGENTSFSDYMNELCCGGRGPIPHYSYDEVLDVFIETFSSSLSNEISNKEDEKNKKMMKNLFEYVLIGYIDKFIYNKKVHISGSSEYINEYLSNYKKINKSV